MLSGKIWGQTLRVTSNPAFEFHYAQVRKGGTCSRHRHSTKFNGFFVVSGRLAIDVWHLTGRERTILGPHQYTQVAPPAWHQFEALEDTEVVEVYWAQFDPSDIERDMEHIAHH